MLFKRKVVLCILLMFVVSLVSCASMPMSQDQQYLYALKEYTSSLKKYNDWYDIQPPAVQQRWKEKIDPQFKKLGLAVDAYGAAIGSGKNVEAAADNYLAAKTIVFKLLMDAGVITIKAE